MDITDAEMDEAWKNFKQHPEERYRNAKRGPFTLRPASNATQQCSGRRWEIIDARNVFVAGHVEKHKLELVMERLMLLYAEWLMIKPDTRKCILCDQSAEPGSNRCAFHEH